MRTTIINNRKRIIRAGARMITTLNQEFIARHAIDEAQMRATLNRERIVFSDGGLTISERL